jgi:hypothetical protein
MPRWVWAFVIAGVVLLGLVLVALVAGGGHGPGRHGASGPLAGVDSLEPIDVED